MKFDVNCRALWSPCKGVRKFPSPWFPQLGWCYCFKSWMCLQLGLLLSASVELIEGVSVSICSCGDVHWLTLNAKPTVGPWATTLLKYVRDESHSLKERLDLLLQDWSLLSFSCTVFARFKHEGYAGLKCHLGVIPFPLISAKVYVRLQLLL